MVQRSNNNSNTNGGVAYADAGSDSSFANPNNTSRLAFRGECTEETDVETFKKIPDEGVYIQDIDGNLWKAEDWNQDNSRANGVAVVDTQHPQLGFVISKNHIEQTFQFGSENKLLNNIVTTTSNEVARTDYLGKSNTEQIITQDSPTCEAAIYCSNYEFPNGNKGYLGATGEWRTAYNNKSEIDNCITTIGGDVITDNISWCSTQSSENEAYGFSWFMMETKANKTSLKYVRPFTTLQ